MDKRYLLIIIIIGICCVNLYMVSNVSDVVGSASTNAGKYIFTLPNGFTLYETSGSEAKISNPQSNMTIQIYTELGKNNTFSNKYKELTNDTSAKIISNGTINSDGMKIDSLFYQYHNKTENRSTFYFEKENNNFRILIIGFDYNTQKNEIIDIATQIAESIKVNYKML